MSYENEIKKFPGCLHKLIEELGRTLGDTSAGFCELQEDYKTREKSTQYMGSITRDHSILLM